MAFPTFNKITGRAEYQVTVLSGTTCEPVFFRREFDSCCTVAIGPSGTATVQFTLSPEANVIADADGENVNWKNWYLGDVTSFEAATIVGKITAVRAISTTGDAVFEVQA